jgi:DNA-binding MarR family transcriptional regulator
MSARTVTQLNRLDVSLSRLRRLWESPGLKRWFGERMGTRVDLSTIRVLRAVELTGGDCGVGDVASYLGVDASTASRLVDQTVSAGYLIRGTSPADRRRSVLAVTVEGVRVLARALEIREALLTELTTDWPAADVEQLAALLERLADRVNDLENRS